MIFRAFLIVGMILFSSVLYNDTYASDVTVQRVTNLTRVVTTNANLHVRDTVVVQVNGVHRLAIVVETLPFSLIVDGVVKDLFFVKVRIGTVEFWTTRTTSLLVVRNGHRSTNQNLFVPITTRVPLILNVRH